MTHLCETRITLLPEQLYGWTMYPGYSDEPYRSPILVYSVQPLGGRTFELNFLNILYASGVQRMSYRLRTLRREQTYLILEQISDGGPTERSVIIEELTRSWMLHAAMERGPKIDSLFNRLGEPDRTAFLSMAGSF